MRKHGYLKLLFLLTGFLFTACSGSQLVTSQQNTGEIKIDGNSSEWKQLTNMKGENISFGFSNDADNLYLIMITNDRNKIMNILRGGLKVWIDPGNSDDKIGIKYPDSPEPADMMEQMKNQRMQDQPGMDNKNFGDKPENNELDPAMTIFLSQQKDLYVINDDDKVLKSFPINGSSYQASFKVDRSSLCYELKIPFGHKPLLNYVPKNNSVDKISVNFVSGELKLPNDPMQRPDGMGGNGMPPSGGPSMGGGPGGGGPPSGGGPGGGGPGGGGPGGPNQSKQSNVPIDYSFEVIMNK
jgi:hypothetical protein